MNYADMLQYAFKSLKERSLRSGLTVLGIVIGIAAIVILISLAQGLDVEIRKQLDQFGTNYMTIIPGKITQYSSFGPPSLKGALYERDVERLKNVGGVKGVSPYIMMILADVEYKDSIVKGTVNGVDADVMNQFIKVGLEDGRFMKSGDLDGIFIGNKVAHEFFDEDVSVGDVLLVNRESFRVRGIINKAGDVTGDFDEGIYIDVEAARRLAGRENSEQVDAIMVVTEESADVREVAKQVDFELQKSHKVGEDDKDYQVLTPEQFAEQLSIITGLLSLFLGGIAAIALVVGGIGVANAMFTSVLERTREIGLLKAIGATPKAIRNLFLVEAGVLGLAGGVLGVLLGAFISWLLRRFGVPSVTSWELLAFALLFSVGVGMASGFVPARNASRLEPVDALRYE